MVLHLGRGFKKIITALILLLTVSMVLVVSPTITTLKITATNPLNSNIQTTSVAGDVLWNTTYGGTGSDEGRYVEQTSDGGYIILGTTNSFGAGSSDFWLIKIDENCKHEWNQTYGGTDRELGYRAVQTSDGGYIMVGITGSILTQVDVLLIKTNSTGGLEWNETYGGLDDDYGYWVEQTDDGGYIITGLTRSYGPGVLWLLKANSTGDPEWNKTYDGVGNCVLQTSDKGYIIVGHTESYGAGSNDVWLIKTNSTGGLEWNKTYGGVLDDIGRCIAHTSDGGYIILASTESFGFSEYDSPDVWLIKTDHNGNHQWNKTYGTTEDDEGYSLVETSDNGYIITGDTSFYGAFSKFEVLLIKTDQNGNEIWNKTYGGPERDFGKCVEQTSDGGYLIVGETESFGAGYYTSPDVWLIKVSDAPPTIDEPSDITYEEGETGNNITWQPRDVNPNMYTITQDGILVDSGDWDGGDITYNIDNLPVGTYIFTCAVNDTLGNSASDSVTVTVTEPVPEFTKQWAGVTLGFLAALIALTTLRYKKEKK